MFSLLGRNWNLAKLRNRKNCTSALIWTVLVDVGLCWGGVVRFPVFVSTLKRMFKRGGKHGSELSITKASAKEKD